MSSRSPPPVGPSPQFAARHAKIHRPTPLSLKKLPEPPLSNIDLEVYNILPSTVYSPEFDEPQSDEERRRSERSATPTDISGLFDNSETETSSSSSAASSRAESPVDRDGGFVVRRDSRRSSRGGVRLSGIESRSREQSERGSRRNSHRSSGRNSGRNSGRAPGTPVSPMSPNYSQSPSYPPPLPPSSSSSNRPSISSSSSHRPSISRPSSSANEPRPISPSDSADELEWTPMPAVYSTRPPPNLSRRPSRKMKAVLGIGMAYPPLPASRTGTPGVQSPVTPKPPPAAPAPISAMYAPIAAPASSVSVKAPKNKGLKEKEKKEKKEKPLEKPKESPKYPPKGTGEQEKPKESPKHPPKATAPRELESPKESPKYPPKATGPRELESPKESPKYPPKATEQEKPQDSILDNWDISDSDSSANRNSLPKLQPQELKPWQPLSLKKPPAPSIAPSTTPSTSSAENTNRPIRPLRQSRQIEQPQPRPAAAMRAIHRSATTASDGYEGRTLTTHSRRASKGEQLEVAFKLVTTAESPGGQVYPGGVGGFMHTQSSADIRTSRGSRGSRSRSREESDSSDSFTIDLPKRSPSAPVATRSLTNSFTAVEDRLGEFVLDEYPVHFSTLPTEEASIFNIVPGDLTISDMFPLPPRPRSQSQAYSQAVHQFDGDLFPTYTIHPAWSAPDNKEVYLAAEKQRKEELAALAAMMDPASPAAVSFRTRYSSNLEPIMCSPTTTTFPVRPPTGGSLNVSPTTASPMGAAMGVPPTPTTPAEPSPASVNHSSRWSDYSEAESVKESWRASVLNHFHLPSVTTVRRKLDLKGGVAAAKEGIRKMAPSSNDLRPGSGTKDARNSAEEIQRKSTESHKATLPSFAPVFTNNRASTSLSTGLVSRVGSRIANGRSDSIVTLGKNILTRPESRSERPPMTLGLGTIRSNSMNSHSKRPDMLIPPSTASTMPTLSTFVGSSLPLSTLGPPPLGSPGSDVDEHGLSSSPGSRRFKGVFEKYMVKDPRKKEERRRMELKRKITVIGAGQSGGYI